MATTVSQSVSPPNGTNDIDNNYISLEYYVRLILPPVFGLIVLLGLIGNTLVIIVVATNRNMRTTTNMLILNLAVADLCFIIFCVPFTAVGYAWERWPFGEIWCKTYQYLTYVSCYASIYTLVVTSLERYFAIVRPVSSLSFRARAISLRIILIKWLVIILANLPILIESTVIEYKFYDEHRSACTLGKLSFNEFLSKLFYGSFFLFGYALPLLLICILYGLILNVLCHSKTPGESHTRDKHQKKIRATFMVVIVVVAFAVCWMPIQVIFIIQNFGQFPSDLHLIIIQFVANILAYTNSCINPILYTFLSSNFRQHFRNVCNSYK